MTDTASQPLKYPPVAGYKATWPETIFFSIGFGFVAFWSLTHSPVYFLWKIEDIFEDFKQVMFGPNVTKQVSEGFYTCCMEPLYRNRLTDLRIHLLVAAPAGILMILQLLPQVRTKNYMRHRILGYVTNLLTFIFLVHMGYVIFIRGLPGMPPVIFWFDVVSYTMIISGYFVGVGAILARKIALHRSMMMLCAAGMLSNAVQRLVWAICSQTMKVDTYEEWVDGPLTISSIITLVIQISTAFYYGFITKPLSIDLSRGKIIAKKD